jgi:hypothetical protein
MTHYIVRDMPKVLEYDGFEIRVNPQRDSPWVEVATRSPH